jgi:hypothetical protein
MRTIRRQESSSEQNPESREQHSEIARGELRSRFNCSPCEEGAHKSLPQVGPTRREILVPLLLGCARTPRARPVIGRCSGGKQQVVTVRHGSSVCLWALALGSSPDDYLTTHHHSQCAYSLVGSMIEPGLLLACVLVHVVLISGFPAGNVFFTGFSSGCVSVGSKVALNASEFV